MLLRLVVVGVAILWLRTTAAKQQAPASTQEHIHQIESCISPPVLVKGDPVPCQELRDRMAEMHIAAVSIAVVHHGVLEWARGYGVKQVSGSAVTPETLFQAGSISKPLAALGALRLVQQGKLALDSDVNAKLTTWKIPLSPAATGAVVTLRELLTHTAGFAVHGFPAYAATTPVPTLVQVLNGEPPANTAPIRLESVPGSGWKYSGGGFTVMQQLVVDVTKKPFATFLHDAVLQPVGMTHSTYQQPLPSALLRFAAMP